MAGVLKWIYKVFRTVVVTVILLTLITPAALYVALSLPSVQRSLKSTAETELSALLGVKVAIGELDYRPFNRLALKHVDITTAEGTDTIAKIRRLGAGVNLSRLLTTGDLVVNYVELIGLDGRINRAAPGEPLNIQPIIDALSPKHPDQPPTHFDLKIATVVIRRSAVSYDVLSAPAPQPGKLDPNHLSIRDFRADIALPRLTNDDFTIDLLGMAATERSGLQLKRLEARAHITDTQLTVEHPLLQVGQSAVRLSDVTLSYSSLKSIGRDLPHSPIAAEVLPGTQLVGADLAPLVPALADMTTPLLLTARVSGRIDDLHIESLDLHSTDRAAELELAGRLRGLGTPDLAATVDELHLGCDGGRASQIIGRFASLSPSVSGLLTRAATITLDGSGSWSRERATFDGTVATAAGLLALDGAMHLSAAGSREIEGQLSTTDFDLGALLARADLGQLSADVSLGATISGRGALSGGRVEGLVSRFDFREHPYTDITADLDYDGTMARGRLAIADPQMTISADGSLSLEGEMPQIDLLVIADEINLDLFGAKGIWAGRRLSLHADTELTGRNVNSAAGHLDITGLSLSPAPDGTPGLTLGPILVTADNTAATQHADIRSEVVDGRIEGSYRVTDVPLLARELLARILPTLLEPAAPERIEAAAPADLTFTFTIKPNTAVTEALKVPVNVVRPVDIDGYMNSADGSLSVSLLAPAIIKGGTMLQNTALNLDISGQRDRADIYLTSTLAVKKDHITVALDGAAFDDRIDADLSWNYNRAKRYDGLVRLTSTFSRDEQRQLASRIDINPSEFAVNDTVWGICPAVVTVQPDSIGISGIRVERQGQYVAIDGLASSSPDSRIDIELSDINIDYIFETLAIDNVMFGGDATGRLTASQVLSREPRAYTDSLHVRNLAYNHSLMGDALIASSWDNARRAVLLKADISQPNGRHSYVDGRIMPMVDSLDFHFRADRIAVGFMRPFMAAFAQEVGGYASGEARLWGSFKYIDMVGDIYAEDFRVKLDFTGTEYFCTDSVHLDPGYIAFDDIELHDIYGNKAKLNGWLRHEYFKKPSFRFNVTDADNLLVYDKPGTPTSGDIWYGKVYADGTASVSGSPGKVNISVNMRTSERSTFTFVLTDAMVADDYTFITFRDANAREADATVDVRPTLREDPVEEFFRSRLQQQQADEPSVYSMDIAVDVTPATEVILVMDPVGGDRIRAFGSGNLRLTYASDTEALRMYGTYTLDRGNYNFTLQDIIIKDFTISSGSKILFNGDPYSAQLDIKAEYVVQANLSDLDQSFLDDKDLNRTNVPVHAVMLISGDMRQPDIKFDLAFPTLNSDVDRKVRSIISTDDMMNRQIVYLLTLSRFYTPDYMTATRGNEFVSMASSTLSSQLSSVLGQLSDNWTIAPAVRSDKGDFTDVEVDLALSSTLLNNRLLLNGNFGYRDHALNNNSFIGDFDIEYLLNRPGTIRLKAYNRYNDQNYYVKSALTTQGVGVMFRKDFDSFGEFFRFLRRPKAAEPADTVTAPEGQ